MALENKLRKIIKEIISRKSFTYLQIAERLDISESSVKRAMTSKKMTIAEFEQYCQSLSLNPFDVFLAAHDSSKSLDTLTLEQEHFLCRNPTLDYIFLKLSFGFSAETLRNELELTKLAFKKKLKKIERYSLIKITPSDQVILSVRTPFRWLEDGPFQNTFGTLFPSFVLKYFSNFEKEPRKDLFLKAFEVYLQKETYLDFRKEMNELIEKYRRKSRTEMSMELLEDLKPYSFIFAADQFDTWKSIYLKRKDR